MFACFGLWPLRGMLTNLSLVILILTGHNSLHAEVSAELSASIYSRHKPSTMGPDVNTTVECKFRVYHYYDEMQCLLMRGFKYSGACKVLLAVRGGHSPVV